MFFFFNLGGFIEWCGNNLGQAFFLFVGIFVACFVILGIFGHNQNSKTDSANK